MSERAPQQQVSERLRVDKWLFFTRIVKSRSLATALASGGKVRVNRDKIDRAAFGLRIGDVVTITLRERIMVVKVTGLGIRRGPASEARLLYEDLTPVLDKKADLSMHSQSGPRPTKRDRRKLDSFRHPE